MRLLVAWFCDWPVTAAGYCPESPVAVLGDRRVVAASAAARAEGVRTGMRRREAESRCPGLVVADRDLGAEARAFEPVVTAVAALCPRLEVVRPGLLALEARGPARYLGGEAALCRRVSEAAAGAITTPGAPPPRCGVAEGRFAATLAARRGVVVGPGDDRDFLAGFPVGVLDRPELTDLLGRLGIRTLGAFAGLPAPSVLARFGPDAARAHALARGSDPDPITAAVPPETPSRSTVFDSPVDRVDVAAFAGRVLATELASALADRGLGCTRLEIEAETEHGESLSRLWRGEEALTAEAMVERLRWQLDGWLSGTATAAAPTAGITLLRLTADEVVALGSRQPGLWGGTSDADRQAARGLDRLRGMLGPGAVFTAVLGGGRGPADRVVLVPWGEPRPTQGAPGRGHRPAPPVPWPGRDPLPAPALVHPVPLAAEVADVTGQPVSVSGRGRPSAAPGRLSVDGGPWAEVAAWAGPWTSDERWWDQRGRRRRARFQLLLTDGRAYLCLLERGRWWVEATYD